MELHDTEEAMAIRIRKILAHPQTKENTFGIFKDFHGVMWVQKFNLHPRMEILTVASLTPKSSTCCYCYVFKFFVLTDFFF